MRGVWVRGLSLCFTNPVGVWDMCPCFGYGGVGDGGGGGVGGFLGLGWWCGITLCVL